MSISSLLEKHRVTGVDILIVDAEGMDYEIIKTFDFDRFHPKIVQFELVNLDLDELERAIALLQRYGYVYGVVNRDIIAWLPEKNGRTVTE